MKTDGTTIGRRAFLKYISSLAGTSMASVSFRHRYVWGQVSEENKIDRDFSVEGDTPLRERAARKGLIYGSSITFGSLTHDARFSASFVKECGILVPETELKFDTLRPSPDKFDFAKGDYMLNFAKKNNILFRGHTLVWHHALPEWFHQTVNNQNAEQVLRNHITKVVGHFAGKVHSWDVVNEVIWPSEKLPDGTWKKTPDGMHRSPWYRLLGPEYIDIAFRAASEADPNALLMFNMYHLEQDIKIDEECRIATLKLLKRLKSSGVPVQVLGIQAHINADVKRFNPKIFRTFLRDVAELGLKIMITELEVSEISFPNDINARDRMVASMYEEFLSVALEEKAIIGVLTWGLSDKYTWLRYYMPRADKVPLRPLPLDENCNRKLAWNAIARAFDKAPNR